MNKITDAIGAIFRTHRHEVSTSLARIIEIDNQLAARPVMGVTIMGTVYEDWRDVPNGGQHEIRSEQICSMAG